MLCPPTGPLHMLSLLPGLLSSPLCLLNSFSSLSSELSITSSGKPSLTRSLSPHPREWRVTDAPGLLFSAIPMAVVCLHDYLINNCAHRDKRRQSISSGARLPVSRPAVPLAGCVILGRLIALCVPLFSPLSHKDHHNTHLRGQL